LIEYLIDDVIYDLGEELPRKTVYKYLEKNDFDYDETLNALFIFIENRNQKKLNKKLKNVNKTDKIKWPTSETSKKTQNDKKESNQPQRKQSVNIDIQRKQSKKLHSNFKMENSDKSFWNNNYPIIEYPE
jgi:uncharacterized membrane protein YhiD involved in acid resistance